MRRTDLGFVLIGGVVALAGCVSALREPPPLADLAAASGREGQIRLVEAERLWNQRTIESVREAGERYQASVTDEAVQVEALIGAARAHLWLGDHLEDPDARLAEAVAAIDLAQWCGRVDPGRPECDYWLALGIGLQVQERRSTVVDGLPRVVALLGSSIERDPLMDHAGPHRVLALVHLRAPGWPAGPGDVDLGLEQARIAVDLVPDYPPNRMALAEAHRELDEIEQSRREYFEAQRLASDQAARGVPDAAEWLDQVREALKRVEQR
jgi:hypothetical protein